MKNFKEFVDDLHRNFTMGFVSKEFAVHNFEYLLKTFGYLSKDKELDPEMSEENLLTLINRAQMLPPKTNSAWTLGENPCAEVEVHTDLAHAGGDRSHYSVRGTHGGDVCPMCRKQRQVYSVVQDDEGVTHSVNPPRCENCMWEWAEKNITNPYVPDTKMRPMKQEDWDFFRPYEKQMKEGIE